jgi:hypothetical protein
MLKPAKSDRARYILADSTIFQWFTGIAKNMLIQREVKEMKILTKFILSIIFLCNLGIAQAKTITLYLHNGFQSNIMFDNINLWIPNITTDGKNSAIWLFPDIIQPGPASQKLPLQTDDNIVFNSAGLLPGYGAMLHLESGFIWGDVECVTQTDIPAETINFAVKIYAEPNYWNFVPMCTIVAES